jgi:tRNA pseudouridine38-40 synthase
MPTPRRLRLTIGYRGTQYAGWATQPGRPTVQATLESALADLLGHPIRVTAAGRTDAGVHADAQVVSFDTSASIPAEALERALRLPDDIWIVDAADVATDFDARRSATRRWYRYAIWRSLAVPTAWRGRALVEAQPLNLEAMREASHALLGRHDMAALATQPRHGRSTVRTIFAADWINQSPLLLLFEICADGFLKHMVRAIVGSLLWVGTGHWTPPQFAYAFASTDRRMAGPNAPAVGLTLTRIEYP